MRGLPPSAISAVALGVEALALVELLDLCGARSVARHEKEYILVTIWEHVGADMRPNDRLLSSRPMRTLELDECCAGIP